MAAAAAEELAPVRAAAEEVAPAKMADDGRSATGGCRVDERGGGRRAGTGGVAVHRGGLCAGLQQRNVHPRCGCRRTRSHLHP
ncbi:hypothetical protein ACP70R_019690 [Stipagrostis hirtigluma subsp. patula]